MLEAKASLVAITNFWQTTVVSRLGMPSMVLSDRPSTIPLALANYLRNST